MILISGIILNLLLQLQLRQALLQPVPRLQVLAQVHQLQPVPVHLLQLQQLLHYNSCLND